MPVRTKVNLTMNSENIAEARALGVNMSRVAEEAIAKAVKAERGRLWKIENAEAIRQYNDFVDREGIPFSQHRQF